MRIAVDRTLVDTRDTAVDTATLDHTNLRRQQHRTIIAYQITLASDTIVKQAMSVDLRRLASAAIKKMTDWQLQSSYFHAVLEALVRQERFQ